MKAEGGGPIHFTTSHQFAQASHRTADASSDLSNCPTQSTRSATVLLRKRRSTVARRITDIPALDRPREEGERGGSRDVGAVNVGAEDVPSGQFQTFCRTHERPTSEEGCAALLMAIDVAPSTRLQHARVLRSMLQMHRIPLEMLLLVLQKIAAGSETKQARPSTKESYLKFGAHTITGTKETLTLKLPLTFWLRGGAHCSYTGIPPNSSLTWAGLYRRPFGCSS
ncbi:RNA helicase, putative [Trypanosoma cruzi marinkellei]|uniref:RNA helicase, putative n=1 Tax=Trypanosoma cruzi marinkellei TaxID=85056 RepID=K2PCL2_TRYCR|nr:RNA helicase, putative [Trypanosoma cruzi marinkellei]